MSSKTAKQTVEFGDFQTPLPLAKSVCSLLLRADFEPASIIEPTCGQGTFLTAALEAFPDASIRGYEYNPAYAEAAHRTVSRFSQATVQKGDFFRVDWDAELSKLADPLLVLGNPPWVTNATVGSLGGSNLPEKSNLDGLRGIDAMTGRANFDISEWMLRENLRWLRGRRGAIAVLCKTSVARKVLVHAWSASLPIKSVTIYRLDAHREFGVSVDACLLFVCLAPGAQTRECAVYDALNAPRPSSSFGMRDGRLVSDLETYGRLHSLSSDGLTGWRSGVKHDCSRVFEFSVKNGELVNGLGEVVSLETDVVFPLLKSSDVASRRPPRKYLIVPHRSMDESSHELRRRAPRAWQYLTAHERTLEARASAVYKKRPKFSIFGIGPYSFAPWKVAISGLYKNLRFTKIGLIDGQPILLDDTCYFFPCDSEEECLSLYQLVSSPLALEFWSSLVFWDSKRPITAKLLNLLDLASLAKKMGAWNPTTRRIAERQMTAYSAGSHQPMLFRESSSQYGLTERVFNSLVNDKNKK